jgi:hypothetical protein
MGFGWEGWTNGAGKGIIENGARPRGKGRLERGMILSPRSKKATYHCGSEGIYLAAFQERTNDRSLYFRGLSSHPAEGRA